MTTARTILKDDFDTIAASAVAVLNSSQAVLQLPPDSPVSIFDQVRSSLIALHHIKISDVLLMAWKANMTLNRAAHESLATRTPQRVHINGYGPPSWYG